MKEIQRKWWMPIIFFLVAMFFCFFPVNAEENEVEFTAMIKNATSAQEFEKIESSDIYVCTPTNTKNITKITAKIPKGYTICIKSSAYGSEYTLTKEETSDSENTITYSADINDYSKPRGANVYYAYITDNTNTTKLYYLVYKTKSVYARSGTDGNLFTNPGADLMDVNLNKISDATITYAKKTTQVKQISISDNASGITHVKFTRPHKPLGIYSISIQADWIKPDNNYVRINGGDIVQFNSSSSEDENIVSGSLKLKKGWNVIEAYSMVYAPPGFDNEGKGNWENSNLWDIDNFVWLINYTGDEIDETKYQKNDTSISGINAVNYVVNYNEKFANYATVINNEKNDYEINLPKTLSYPYIWLQVKTKDCDAKVTMPENMVTTSYGSYYCISIGKETTEIPVIITAGDGTKKNCKIQLNRSDSDCTISQLDIDGASLSKEFDGNKTAYVADVQEGSKTITYKVQIPNGDTVTFNGKEGSYEDNIYTASVSASDEKAVIKVTAADGITSKKYIFVNRDSGGNISYFGISDETKKKAKELLSSYLNRTNKNPTGGYWGVFDKASVGESFEDTYVYDVKEHDCSQATDYGGIILELVMIGENPYNFEGTNYVELLEKESDKYGGYNFGPYANNIWALMAFRAAGYEFKNMDRLITTVKNQAFDTTFDLDMRSWALAAVADDITIEEKIENIEEIVEENQVLSGDDTGLFKNKIYSSVNMNSHGCVLSGLTGLGVDVEKFAIDDTHSPLNTMSNYLTEDGLWKYNATSSYAPDYNKDVILGLGDIVNGGSVYRRYIPKNEDLKSLITTAKEILDENTASKSRTETLQTAYDKAVNVKDKEKGFGEEYYNLKAAISEIDRTKVNKPDARMCSEEQSAKVTEMEEKIEAVPEASLDNKKEIKSIMKEYEKLGVRLQSYVSNSEKLLKVNDALVELMVADLEEKISGIGEVSLDSEKAVNEIKEYYDLLSDDEKKLVENADVLIAAINKIDALKHPEKETTKETAFKVKFTASTKKIKLKWNRQSGITGYQISIYNQKSKKYKVIAKVSADKTSYTVRAEKGKKGKKLTSSTNYKFKISTYTVKDNKTVIKKTKKIVAATKPAKMVLKSARAISGTKVRLNWKKIKKCSGYRIYVKSSKKGKYKLFKTVKGAGKSSYTVKGLKKNRTYYFKVKAYKTAGKAKVIGKASKRKVVRTR